MDAVPDHVPADRILSMDWYGTSVDTGDLNSMLFEQFKRGPNVLYIRPNGRNPFGSWLLTRQEQIRIALTDTEHFTSNNISGFNVLSGEAGLLIPVEYDPPDHSRYRAFINQAFNRKSIEELNGTMRVSTNQMIDAVLRHVEEHGFCDVVPFCHAMMTDVWCVLMGAPLEEASRYVGFLMRMLHTFDPAARGRCAADMLQAMRELYNLHKGVELGGLINKFVNGNVKGEPISETEASGFILFMFLAGIDTVGSTTAWILFHLAQHPEERSQLLKSRDLIPKFIEEILRRYAIVTTNRFVKKDIEIDGVILKAGDNVVLSMPLACMDGSAFECPTKMDLDRSERHMAFGAGAHFCVGALLARAQLKIFLEAWFDRLPSFQIREGARVSAHLGDVASLDQLELVRLQ